ncbi:amidase, partial [bacterium]
GSIRIPSSLCGVVGLKPTYGRVSLRGVIPLSWNLDHSGPMARTVRDAAVLLQEIAGYDEDDPGSVNMPEDDYVGLLESEVRGWRIALASGEFFEKVDEDVNRRVREAAYQFEKLGAVVEEVELPEARQAAQGNGFMVVADAATFHQERLKCCPQDFGPDVRQRLENGAASTVQDYIRTRRLQAEMRRKFEAFFEAYDLLLTPATPVTAPLQMGDDAVQRAPQLTRFTAPFNFTGLPAISIPCGFGDMGLPVGLQIVSGPWKEAKVLQAAYQLEKHYLESIMRSRKPKII